MSIKGEISGEYGDVLGEYNALKLDSIASGRDVIDLSMINPDIPPSRFLLDKLLEATVRPINHRYAVARGVRKLREAFAEKYRAAWGVNVSPEEQVCVTMGSKDAIEHTLMALGVDGADVIVGAPTYPNYLSAISLARLSPRFFNICDDEDAMVADIAAKVREKRPAAILLNFPNNPTGLTVSRHFYERLIEIACSSQIVLLNDFVYGEMCYGGRRAVSLLEVPGAADCAAEIYSLSKAYSVPGWRVGALVGNAELVRALARLKAEIDYGIFLPLQHAAAAALTAGSQIPAQVTAQFEERSELFLTGLRRLGWEVVTPRAGCCVWAKLPPALCREGSIAVSYRLLSEAGIAAYPGPAFGSSAETGCDKHSSEGWVRFALAVSPARIQTALERLTVWSAHRSDGMISSQEAIGE